MPAKTKKKPQPSIDSRVLPLDELLEPIDAMREHISTESIASLKQAFISVGQLTLLLVRPRGKKFEIVHGHRRLLAARAAGWAAINCEVRKMSDEETYLARASENLDREDTSPLDEALFVAMMTKKFSFSGRQLAAKLGKSPAWISQRLAINDYSKPLREALRASKITFSIARELHRLPMAEQQQIYLDYAIDNGATPAVVAGWVNDWLEHARRKEQTEADPSEAPNIEEFTAPGCDCYFCNERQVYARLKSLWVCHPCRNTITDMLISIAHQAKLSAGRPPASASVDGTDEAHQA